MGKLIHKCKDCNAPDMPEATLDMREGYCIWDYIADYDKEDE